MNGGQFKLKRNRAGVRRLRPYITLRCPVSAQVGWCRGLCMPIEGRGVCGRVAPHSLKSAHQQAIADFNARQAEDEAPPAG